ncbi:MAG: PAS domain-containing protein, partial [Desulfobaccales bacterium]
MNFPDRIRQLAQDDDLQETKDVLENLLDSSADSIGVVDTKGRFSRWNAASEEIFGYSMADLEDQHFSVLYEDPGDLKKMLARLRRDGFIRKYEINMKKKDGTIAPFNLSIKLLYDRHHNLTGSLCIARDRSDTRRALNELQMLNKRLEKEIIERKKMEGDLWETRETLRALFNAIP